MSPILTEKIPIIILPPAGESPEGYEFLDIWPMQLIQTVSGPEEQVRQFKHEGLEMAFNLTEISKDQLDTLQASGRHDDEVSFFVPDQWKKINTPFSFRGAEFINDPEAKNLQITFLHRQLLPVQNELHIHIFILLNIARPLILILML